MGELLKLYSVPQEAEGGGGGRRDSGGPTARACGKKSMAGEQARNQKYIASRSNDSEGDNTHFGCSDFLFKPHDFVTFKINDE